MSTLNVEQVYLVSAHRVACRDRNFEVLDPRLKKIAVQGVGGAYEFVASPSP